MAGNKLAAVGASLGVFLGTALTAAPSATAHAGPDAIPIVRAFTLAPAAQGWTASVTIIDSDSGTPLPAVDVRMRGAGAAKLTPMVEGTTPGTYALVLPNAAPGPAQLRLQMRTLPGGTPVLDFAEDYSGTLEAGKVWQVAGSAPAAGSGGGGSGTGVIAAGAGALLLVGLGSAFVLRRRRLHPAASG